MLPDSITVFNSEEVLENLSKIINEQLFEKGEVKIIELDATELQDIDGSGLQILLSAHKTCALKNVKLVLNNVNEEIEALLTVTGSNELLERGDK